MHIHEMIRTGVSLVDHFQTLDALREKYYKGPFSTLFLKLGFHDLRYLYGTVHTDFDFLNFFLNSHMTLSCYGMLVSVSELIMRNHYTNIARQRTTKKKERKKTNKQLKNGGKNLTFK